MPRKRGVPFVLDGSRITQSTLFVLGGRHSPTQHQRKVFSDEARSPHDDKQCETGVPSCLTLPCIAVPKHQKVPDHALVGSSKPGLAGAVGALDGDHRALLPRQATPSALGKTPPGVRLEYPQHGRPRVGVLPERATTQHCVQHEPYFVYANQRKKCDISNSSWRLHSFARFGRLENIRFFTSWREERGESRFVFGRASVAVFAETTCTYVCVFESCYYFYL